MEVDGQGVAASLRAEDLMERIEDCKGGINAGGLNEEDLYGRSTREPFRSFCRELSTKILNVVSSSSSSDQQQVQLLKGAVNAVHRTSSTESGSQGGRLDRTLARVIVALNPKCVVRDRLSILEELVDFLQAAAMLHQDQPPPDPPKEGPEKSFLVRKIASQLGVHCSSSQSDACESALRQCVSEVDKLTKDLPRKSMSPLIEKSHFSAKQLTLLREVDDALRKEYKIRRQTLVRRASVCLQSLQHSGRAKAHQEEVRSIVKAGLAAMKDEPSVDFDDLFVAKKADFAALQTRVTKGQGASFDTAVKSVLIGKVPDRGGRVGQQRTASMPQFTARKPSASSPNNSNNSNNSNAGHNHKQQKRGGKWHKGGKRKQGRNN